ncbi:unnamed protein product [Protopolystoma xenopodis]|uniref:Uncharacterized protein n=1 Tax=Protopolystoma xenopodis TaxID=117903 RepID=A0A3S5B5G7_9PLAT|nr:unnamed protein product [Protopolystoma xenopodis]
MPSKLRNIGSSLLKVVHLGTRNLSTKQSPHLNESTTTIQPGSPYAEAVLSIPSTQENDQRLASAVILPGHKKARAASKKHTLGLTPYFHMDTGPDDVLDARAVLSHWSMTQNLQPYLSIYIH